MEIKNKHILVAGLGITGVSVTRFLASRGARVTVTDTAAPEALATRVSMISDLDVNLVLGRQEAGAFEAADLIVLSPGVPHTIAPVLQAARKGVPVIGEIELAFGFIRTPIIAVTGTNGKTTVTTLLGEMLKGSGFSVFVGGNIGTPLIDAVEMNGSLDFVVAEVSSFQLDTIESFRPRVGVLLNITDDHLDRYSDFNAYARSKARIFMNQEKTEISVLNAADPAILSVTGDLKSRRLMYNLKEPVENGAWISGKTLHFNLAETGFHQVDGTKMPLEGRHNLENALAAGLAALSSGASIQAVETAIHGFKGLPHRLSYVATSGGIKFYDDSKATNVDAVIRALEFFSSPVVLILGGRDKGGSYEGLKPQIQRIVRHLVVMGEAGEKIQAALADTVSISMASRMRDAVHSAVDAAAPGDAVLLSPACSSFDLYESYARRGDDFVKAVHEITGGRA